MTSNLAENLSLLGKYCIEGILKIAPQYSASQYFKVIGQYFKVNRASILK